MGENSSRFSAALVSAGILLSRIAGFVRERMIAVYLGNSLYADALGAAMRVPNLLQNLLGDGVLSASFIPVYAELLHQGKKEEAGRVAGAIFALLAAISGAIVLAGIAAAPLLTTLLVPGFEHEQREVTIRLIRIIFPGTGVLVLSAWALGILNCHRQFLLSYAAPVLWNLAIILAFVVYGASRAPVDLVVIAGFGALLGGFLQFGVQLPKVLQVEPGLRIRWDTHLPGVKETLRNALPAIWGRGVAQVSAYIDLSLASWLTVGSAAAVFRAQTLYMLPISLFAMSVAAAELPEMAKERSEALDKVRHRTQAAVERLAFFVVPSAIAFALFGRVLIGALYQGGEFGLAEVNQVQVVLLGYTVGLVATTSSRVYASAFNAIRDTRTPARAATLRVICASAFSLVLILALEPIPKIGWTQAPLEHLHPRLPLGALGLTLGAGLAAWVEWAYLKFYLQRHLGSVSVPFSAATTIGGAAVAAGLVGVGVQSILPLDQPILRAAGVCAPFGVTYFAVAAAFGNEEARRWFSRIRRR